MSDVPCTIACDYCKQSPAAWFGGTSVAVCNRPACRAACNASWEAHCADMEAEHKAEIEMYGDPMAPVGDPDEDVG